MSKLDKIKEEIGWLKIIFSVMAAIDISLIAWLAKNFNSADIILLSLGLFGIALITFLLVWINRSVYKKIDELEDL